MKLARDGRFVHHTRHHDDEIIDKVEIACLPRFKTSGVSGDEWRVSYVTRLWRKGTLLYERGYARMRDAMTHLAWLARVVFTDMKGEDEKRWLARIEEDRVTCFQPGCGKKAAVFYEMKQHGSEDGVFVEDVTKDVQLVRAFCGLHSTRGTASRTDNDKNYKVLAGTPVAHRPMDESPAATVVVDARGGKIAKAVRRATQRMAKHAGGSAKSSRKRK